MSRWKNSRLAPWFTLTRQERWLVLGILGIALVGLTVRAWMQAHAEPEPYQPEPALAGERNADE